MGRDFFNTHSPFHKITSLAAPAAADDTNNYRTDGRSKAALRLLQAVR